MLPINVVLAEIPQAYRLAADQYQVPASLLYAIALTESGRPYGDQIQPWPWAINIDGEGAYCVNRVQCIARSNDAINKKHSVDVGLMQINWTWHHHRFASLAMAWNPVFNLDTGAQILREQYAVTNDWWLAAGRYHAPSNAKRARVYQARVKRQWEALQ